MNKKQAYSWLTQPGIQTAVFHYDKTTNEALKVAMETLGGLVMDPSTTPSTDLVSRQYLLEEYDRQHEGPPGGARKIIETAPPVQSERDIPRKPNSDIDHTWGIPRKHPVCPNCDVFLQTVHFIGDGKKKVSYCDRCGQAIDWSEWEVEHEHID